jgi:hypothetical protein
MCLPSVRPTNFGRKCRSRRSHQKRSTCSAESESEMGVIRDGGDHQRRSTCSAESARFIRDGGEEGGSTVGARDIDFEMPREGCSGCRV